MTLRWVGPGRPTRAELAELRRMAARGELPTHGTISRAKLGKGRGAAAAREYERTHWGNPPRRVLHVRLPDFGELFELGKLRAVEYETTKGGDHAIWVHKFSKPYPSLTVTPRGKLGPIVGGAAVVTERGIEK